MELNAQEFEKNMRQLETRCRANQGIGLAKIRLEKAIWLLLQPQSSKCFGEAKTLLDEAAVTQQEYESDNLGLELEIKLELAALLTGLGKSADAEHLLTAIAASCNEISEAQTQVRVLCRMSKLVNKAEEGLPIATEALRIAEKEWGRNSEGAISCVHDLGTHLVLKPFP